MNVNIFCTERLEKHKIKKTAKMEKNGLFSREITFQMISDGDKQTHVM